MKSKKWFILIFICFILIIYFGISHPKYDIDRIEKLISKHINTNQTVKSFNMTVVKKHHLVSYILQDSEGYGEVGYAHVLYNSKNKYEIIDIIEPDKIIEKSNDIILYEFSNLQSEFSSLELDGFTINTSVFIISNDPKLSKIERITPNDGIQERLITSNPSISFFDVLDEDNEIEYKFYNKDKSIIK